MNLRKSIAAVVLVLLGASVSLAAAESTLVYFDQPESAQLFQESDVKTPFWTLARYFISEQVDTFCGVASSIMVLNALEVPSPTLPFAYPYKKFDQENIFNSAVLAIKPANRIMADGLTLEQLSALLATFGMKVETHHADTTPLDRFRELAVNTLKAKDHYIVVNFSRVALGQVGDGHISPLAAYHQKTDRFLMLDVARYKYPPAWVAAEDLWKAMNTEDVGAKAKRGFVIVSRQ